jgi:hypothetical protein
MSFQGVEDGKARLRALPMTREELRALAYHGLVSEALRVVRSGQ